MFSNSNVVRLNNVKESPVRVLIVIDHPYEGSYSRALAAAAIRGATSAGHDVDVIDLDLDDFDPVVRRADLGAWREGRTVDPRAAEYQDRLAAADHLVLVHPVWWEVMPARLKGFFDKVLVPGFAYTESQVGTLQGLLGLSGVTLVTTMTTPGPLYRLWFGAPVHRVVARGVFGQLGVPRVRWVNHPRVAEISPARRARWLTALERRFASLPEPSGRARERAARRNAARPAGTRGAEHEPAARPAA
ncbi:NAD(P)H-dependent oxidoreductase [Oerskovia sp. KBS0722]|uniref:NAD(P)H-dependent oxidoreductase n=1 Tax=Oerskovia sp. KBS0722 TaxID=1179673 RepID=UPI00110E74F7|nr:NAD(P)H-dependent oxidoreductase [Oerskovia sp. KBS0722]QDW63837.1 NAD(P)H dehydrogenase [Oerskovia sp. KBS0722]